jgi:tetraacyldisaccharide 4'-kinase
MGSKNILFMVVRILLYPFALIYGAMMWLRNRLYDAKFFSSIGFSVPVICVGNLSTGGTGKTPHVEYLIRLLQYQYRAATMSRGYKRHSQGFIIADADANALRIGDEPMQYHIKFPELVVCVAEERITGIPFLLQRRPEVDVILLDDAYQHRSVKAGMNILITDHAHPFYKDYILPFGSLREGRGAYKRANVIIVSKCPDALSLPQANEITNAINPLPHQQVYFTNIHYGHPYDFFSREAVNITGSHVILVCGIARPEPLIAHLSGVAAEVHTLSYNDHHYFVSKDLEEIQETHNNWNKPNKIIVTTEKDAARLYLLADKLKDWNITIAVIPIMVKVLFDKGAELNSTVINYIEKEIAENNEYGGSNPPPPDIL